MRTKTIDYSIGSIDDYAMKRFIHDVSNYTVGDDVKKINFDFSNTSKTRLFPCLVIGESIKKFKEEYIPQGVEFGYINTDVTEGGTYANTAKFYDYIGAEGSFNKVINDRVWCTFQYMPITRLSSSFFRKQSIKNGVDFNQEVTNVAVTIACKVLEQDNGPSVDRLSLIIREMVRNVFEHSDVDHVYLTYQKQQYNNRVEVAILDNGCGVVSSMTSNPLFGSYSNNPVKAVERVLSAGVSRTFNNQDVMLNRDTNWENSGYGLYIASRICSKLKGDFTMLSSGVFINIKADKTGDSYETITENIPFKGCAIKLELKLSELDNFEHYYDLLMEEAKSEPKLKNSYANPSKYSGNL